MIPLERHGWLAIRVKGAVVEIGIDLGEMETGTGLRMVCGRRTVRIRIRVYVVDAIEVEPVGDGALALGSGQPAVEGSVAIPALFVFPRTPQVGSPGLGGWEGCRIRGVVGMQ